MSRPMFTFLSLLGVLATLSGGPRAEALPLARALPPPADEPRILRLDIDARAWRELWSTAHGRIEAFPLPGRQPVDLELRSVEVLAPNARLVAVDRDGERVLQAPEIRFFRGSVAGDVDSLVSLSLFDNRIAGFVRAFGEEFEVGPRAFDLAREGAMEVRVWNRRAMENGPRQPFCPGEPREVSRSRTPRPAPLGVGPGTGLVAHLAVDATVEWFNHFGSLAAAQNYILNLVAQVSTLYDSEIQVQLDIAYLRVFTAEPDPYTGGLNVSTLLDEFQAEWNANQTGVSRSLAHLFSIRPSGASGIAYLDILCDNNINPGSSADYGVSSLEGDGGGFERDLVAHELGHGFSSPHTHCYVPEIDRCANESGCYQGPVLQSVGTIMSYCDVALSTFGSRVRDERLRPAAEAAVPLCLDIAGSPGDVRAETGDALRVAIPTACPTAALSNDDGSLNSHYGALGIGQLAWVKRFRPGCYPFQLQRADVMIGSASVAVGRPMRVLVFAEPSGSLDPGDAVLVHTQDVVVQVVSNTVFNQFALTSPVTLSSGDFYLGFYDLTADAPNTFIAAVDSSRSGDSYSAINSTDPGSFSAYAPGTWMIRGAGGPVSAGSVSLSWGDPCNDDSVPGQDFAVYRGTIGAFTSYTPLACTTDRAQTFLAASAPSGSFFLVVPRTNTVEGSYGRLSSGAERPPAAGACAPQEATLCP